MLCGKQCGSRSAEEASCSISTLFSIDYISGFIVFWNEFIYVCGLSIFWAKLSSDTHMYENHIFSSVYQHII